MGTLLVTCCNVARWHRLNQTGAGLLAINTDTRLIEKLIRPADMWKYAEGITGLCEHGDGYAVSLQGSGATKIGLLNRTLDPIDLFQTTLVFRPHSLVSVGEVLLSVSSGRDAIVAITQAPDGRLDEEIAWAYSSMRRVVHLNSLAISSAGEWYVSGFGHTQCECDSEVSLSTGFISQIHEGVNHIAVSGLAEPHSILCVGESIMFCESARGAVRDLSGISLQLPKGYIRGLAIGSGSLYVGISERRTGSISKSRELLSTLTRQPVGAEVIVFEWDSQSLNTAKETARVPLHNFAREIFDLLYVDRNLF